MGDVLVERGLITQELLDQRLLEQHEQGSKLGKILLAAGDVSRRDLWSAMAQTWQIDSIDLIAEPPDPELLAGLDSEIVLEQRWVPVRIEEDGAVRTAVVAVCDEPTDARRQQVRSALGVNTVRFVATTDWDIEQAVLAGFSDDLVTRAAYELAEERPELSAADPIAKWQKVTGALVPLAVVVGALVNWRVTLTFILVVLNLVFAVGVGFKLFTCFVGMWVQHRHDRERKREQASRTDDPNRLEGWDIPEDELPIYTILVPAFREANVVSDVVRNISALDYPLSKLQVLLLLEPDDVETIEAAKAARPPDFVRLVVVPPGGPQTKPKACNVGLAMAEGEFLVIYDAEDRPEGGQLREAVAAFRRSPDETVCVQARLNYFNTDTNILTRMFTLEYSFWFDDMLPGLDALRLPIPLGGTSNHFRVESLRELGGWDPFNVTEDADLGVRAAALGMKVGIIESTTWEEACSEWKAWIRQRTRWIKGYMVTTLVQLSHPVQAWRSLGWRGMVGLVGLIAGTPALFLAAPLMWAFFLYTFLGGVVPQFRIPGWLAPITFAVLVFGNLSMILINALAVRRRGNTRLAGYALLNPAYWVLHSIASWRALWQVIVSPSHWEKTPHGIEHGPAPVASSTAD